MAVNEDGRTYTHPIYETLLAAPGLSVLAGSIDQILTWGLKNALWIFPMATSCCGIEFMAASASRVDLDRMGTIPRATPRQADVMVVAGTITVKMAPRVKKLWDQMPEPKWCVAMGSCAISGDFYRDLYPTVPGIDTVIPVDVYIPGCPPNPEAVMGGMLRLREKIELVRAGKWTVKDDRPETAKMANPAVRRILDPARDGAITARQVELAGTPSPDSEEHPPVTVEAVGAGVPSGDLQALLAERFGVTDFPKDAPPLLDPARHVELARTLRAMGYTQYITCVASHWPGEAEAFEVATVLRTVGKETKLAAWRVKVPAGTPVDSLCSVFAGADWQEREQFDLLGVRFAGHPDLRRIMMPEDYEGHPLRRDFASDAPCAPWR